MSTLKKGVDFSNFKGITNVLSPQSTTENYLKTADNILLDKAGNVAKRKGYSLVDAGDYSSIWASEIGLGCYCVKDGYLSKITKSGTAFTVAQINSTLLTRPVSFAEVNDTVYLVSPEITGKIVNGVYHELGIPKCTFQVTPQPIEGSLLKGTYQISLTFVRPDGLESGTVQPSIVVLSTTGGLRIGIPNIDSTYKVRVYMSHTDGSEVYYHGETVPNSVYSITSPPKLSSPLKTFNLDAPPIGSIVRYCNGHLFIAYLNVLFYSESLQLEHFKMDSNYLLYDSDIVDVIPVEDGLWVATNKLYYIAGKSPDSFNQEVKEVVKVVKGTATRVSGSFLNIDNTPPGYKWLVTTNLGIFALFNQGLAINMTAKTMVFDQASEGASTLLQDGEVNQYLSVLRPVPDGPNVGAVSDMVEATIIRNGVVVPI